MLSVSPNLYFHNCFPGVASTQRLSSDFRLAGSPGWLTMIYEFWNHNKCFLGATLNLDNYQLFIDSVLAYSAEIMCLDIKKSSFSEVHLKWGWSLLFLVFTLGNNQAANSLCLTTRIMRFWVLLLSETRVLLAGMKTTGSRHLSPEPLVASPDQLPPAAAAH